MPKPLHPLAPIASLADLHRAVPGIRGSRELRNGAFGMLEVHLPWWFWLIPGRVAAVRRRLADGLPVGTFPRVRPSLW